MSTDTKRIEILGSGCARCQETYRVVRAVAESTGLACEVVKVESLQRMAELGVMATPAVAVDGTVVLAGRIPNADEVRQLLGIA
jgi:small redox-active disulfide protein 2